MTYRTPRELLLEEIRRTPSLRARVAIVAYDRYARESVEHDLRDRDMRDGLFPPVGTKEVVK